MFEPVSALNGAVYEGFARVTDAGPRGMITLRGGGDVLAKAAETLGLTMPDTQGMTAAGELRLAWMSPDEALVLCGYEEAPHFAATLSAALQGAHALVAVMSDARSVFRVEGALATDVLRKLTPAPLDALTQGTLRRTRFSQVAAAFWMTGPDQIEIMCFRSQAGYMFDLLCNAARPGSELHVT